MKRTSRLAKIKVILFCLLTLVFIFGCKGSDTREQVDDVVEEAAGKKNVERMQRMKQDIEQIKKDQQNRYDQLDTGKDENN